MTVYGRQIALAHRLIGQKGQSATWIKNTVVVDSSQPWKTTPGSAQTFPVTIVRLPMGSSEAEAVQRLQPGTSVETKREQYLMAGDVPFVPELNDSVTIGGETFQPVTISPLKPDGTPIMYTMTFV